jgi:hypothetical protein
LSFTQSSVPLEVKDNRTYSISYAAQGRDSATVIHALSGRAEKRMAAVAVAEKLLGRFAGRALCSYLCLFKACRRGQRCWKRG